MPGSWNLTVAANGEEASAAGEPRLALDVVTVVRAEVGPLHSHLQARK